MKYKITVDIDSSEKLSAKNLQQVKSMVEKTVIENLTTPNGVDVFINTKVTKED